MNTCPRPMTKQQKKWFPKWKSTLKWVTLRFPLIVLSNDSTSNFWKYTINWGKYELLHRQNCDSQTTRKCQTGYMGSSQKILFKLNVGSFFCVPSSFLFLIFQLLQPRTCHQNYSDLMHCLLGYITTRTLVLYRCWKRRMK